MILSNHTASPETRPGATPAAMSQMLTRLWQKNEDVFRERLRVLAETAATLCDGALTPQQQELAASEAHKLAGSLGMFGFPQGSVLARRAEEMLTGHQPLEADAFMAVVIELHGGLPL